MPGGETPSPPELAVQLDSGNGTVGTDIVAVPASALSGWTYVSVIVPWAHITPGSTYNVYLRTVRAGNSGGTLLAYFDDITMTPVRQIAKIDFESARSVPLIPDGNYNLHSQNNVGMVFHVSNTTAAGGMLEIKYVFSNGDLTTFPAENPDLLRFPMPAPLFPLRWVHLVDRIRSQWSPLPSPKRPPSPMWANWMCLG
jgi:hypothetical protein